MSYHTSFQKYGVSPKSLKWKTQEAAEKRYIALTENIDFENKSILDLGCGFGDIIPFIENKAKNFNYTGVDITKEFIQEAKELYPNHKFIEGDFMNDELRDFDIILACGPLNSLSIDVSARKKIIKKFFNKSKKIFAFNMAGGEREEERKGIFYVNYLDILKYCLTLTNKITFKTGYAYKDFTIVMCR